MKWRILFVDDEPNVLQGLRRSLRNMSKDWEMEFVSSGAAALEMLSTTRFDIVVSDMRMPEMDGSELLCRIGKRYPHIVRIALTGHTSHETALRTAGTAHQFLTKPCDAAALICTIQRACDLRQRLKRDSLQKLIAGLTTLPSVPSLYHQIVDELQKPDASMHRVSALVSRDIAMTAKLLQLVNSSFFGLTQRVANVSQAVVLLGADTIKALTLTVGVFSQCSGAKKHIDSLVNHSLSVGTGAKAIASAMQMPRVGCEDAFMAGLLHDIGELVLISSFPEAYDEILLLIKEEKLDKTDIEYQVFGATHADVGAGLLSLWAFPDEIVEAVAFHHSPSKCLAKQFTPLTAVHLANSFAHVNSTCRSEMLDMEYLRVLKLDSKLDDLKEACCIHVPATIEA